MILSDMYGAKQTVQYGALLFGCARSVLTDSLLCMCHNNTRIIDD